MLCDHCHEEQATVVVTHSINGKKIELRLCNSCASKKQNIVYDEESSFEQFLSGLLQSDKESIKPAETGYLQEVKCPKCKMSLSEFRKNTKLGCEHCYKAFWGYLKPVLRSVQGSSIHKGKKPKRIIEKTNHKEMIQKMEYDLKLSLMQEEYEKAALLRDKIRELKSEARET